MSRGFGGVRLSANLGYRARSNIVADGLAIKDELISRLGLGYRLSPGQGPPVQLDLSVSASTAASDPLGSSLQNHFEVLAGASYDLSPRLQGVVAGGLGLGDAVGTPGWRVVAGVRMSRHIRDHDGDGILDRLDARPCESTNRLNTTRREGASE